MLCSLLAMFREVCLFILVPRGQENNSTSPLITSAACDKQQRQDTANSMHSSESRRSVMREPYEGPQPRGDFAKHLKTVVQTCDDSDELCTVNRFGPDQR